MTAISATASPELLRRYGVVPLVRDGDGNLHLTFEPPRLFRVEVLSGPKPAVDLVPPADGDPSREAMGSEALRAFGRDAAGGVDPAASPFLFASRIADHLATRFFYSLDSARWGPNPVEEFLTQRKSGHCETFATAMALVLREHGIPSRLVTGFAGGERGPFGSYYLVRGLDAHAWVEAWCGPGLRVGRLRPDAPGRPAGGHEGQPPPERRAALREPRVPLRPVRPRFRAGRPGLARPDRPRRGGGGRRDGDEVRRGRLRVALAGSPGRLALLLLAAAAAAAGLLLLRRGAVGGGGFGTRGLPPASAAYRRLQQRPARRGADLTPASAPSETLASADRLGAGRISREIVGAYVAESFGGRPTPDGRGGAARRPPEGAPGRPPLPLSGGDAEPRGPFRSYPSGNDPEGGAMTRSRLATLALSALLAAPGLSAGPSKAPLRRSSRRRSPSPRTAGSSSTPTRGTWTITAWDRAEVAVHAVVTPDGTCDTAADLVAKTQVRIEGGGREVRVESDYDDLPKMHFSFGSDCGSRPFVAVRDPDAARAPRCG